jgi:hypothetical protein
MRREGLELVIWAFRLVNSVSQESPEDHSRGYENSPLLKKNFVTLAIIEVVKNVFFLIFLPFSGLDNSWFACGRITFDTQRTQAAREDHDVTPFFKLRIILKDASQNKTKGIKKLLMAKMLEIGPGKTRRPQELLWPTTWASAKSV